MPTDNAPPINFRVRGRSFMALVLAPQMPLAGWLGELDAQMQRSPAFFDGRPVVVDLGGLPREQPDVAELLRGMQTRGINIIGTEGAHPAWEGIDTASVASWGRLPGTTGRAPRNVELPAAAEAAPSEGGQSANEVASMLLDHSIRSGQSLVFEQGDVTIVGSVASGAEIIAGGSIHVYGTLRGRAIAGLGGHPKSRVFCRRLEAELIAIDGLYKTADSMPPELRGRAAQAWLDGDAINVAAVD